MQIDDDLRGKRKPKQKNQIAKRNELTQSNTQKEMGKKSKIPQTVDSKQNRALTNHRSGSKQQQKIADADDV